ncbi:MAG: hypothetical protein R3C16_13300 [Hyphomonadaceae bacterium]
MRAALFLSAALIVAPAAYAQDNGNNQYQSGDAEAETELYVGQAHDVGATAVAAGNVANSDSQGDFEIDSVQHMDGDTSADADVTAWQAGGNVAVTSAAVANGGTAVTSGGDVEINATQLSHGDANASVRFRGGYAGNAGTSASAAGNVGALSSENGEIRAYSTQEATGSYTANAETDLDYSGGQVVSGAIASANNLSLWRLPSLAGDEAERQGRTRWRARRSLCRQRRRRVGQRHRQRQLGRHRQSVGLRQRPHRPGSIDPGRGAIYVTLSNGFQGFGSAGAYGVGSAATVSNIGSDTVLDVVQENTGGVSMTRRYLPEAATATRSRPPPPTAWRHRRALRLLRQRLARHVCGRKPGEHRRRPFARRGAHGRAGMAAATSTQSATPLPSPPRANSSASAAFAAEGLIHSCARRVPSPHEPPTRSCRNASDGAALRRRQHHRAGCDTRVFADLDVPSTFAPA